MVILCLNADKCRFEDCYFQHSNHFCTAYNPPFYILSYLCTSKTKFNNLNKTTDYEEDFYLSDAQHLDSD